MYEERHRLGTRLWFWLIPVANWLVMGVSAREQGASEFSGQWLMPAMIFIVAFAPMGYRLQVDATGLRVGALGFMRLFEVVYTPIWRRLSFRWAEVTEMDAIERRGIGGHFAWPILNFLPRFRHRMDFGSAWALRVQRPAHGRLIIGLRAHPKAWGVALPMLNEPIASTKPTAANG